MNKFIWWLKGFFDSRTDYERGEEFAKKCIENGAASVASLMINIDTARQYGEYNDFDRGAESELGKRRDLWPAAE